MTPRTLAPGVAIGVEIPGARRTRIAVDDGTLTASTPAGPRSTDVGSLTRAVVLPAVRRRASPRVSERIALFAGDRVALSFWVGDFCSNPLADVESARRISRAGDLAAACRLPLEAGTAADAAAVGRASAAALQVPHFTVPSSWGSNLVIGLGAVVAFASWPLTFSGDSAGRVIGLVLGLAALLVAGRPLAFIIRQRRRFLAVADSQPDVPGATVLTTEHASPRLTQGLSLSRLHLSHDWIVLHDRGTEIWAAGPGNDGVVALSIGSDQLRFTDRRGEAHLLLERELWAATPEGLASVIAAGERTGLHVTVVDGPVAQRLSGFELLGAARNTSIYSRVNSAYQAGGVSWLGQWFAGILTAMVFAGPLALVATEGTLWALPFLVVDGLVFGAICLSSYRLRRWSRRQAKPWRKP